MLALWSLKNGYALHSLHIGENKAALLAGEGSEPQMEICPVGLYWKILDKRIGESQQSLEDIEKKESWMAPLAEFMLEADKAGRAGNILDESIPSLKIGSSELRHLGGGNWKLFKNGNQWKFCGRNGAWFEKLCAFALKREGAKDVTLNMKELWSEKNENIIRNRKKNTKKEISSTKELHKLEVDVVGSIGNTYILISCKSDPQKKQSQDEIDKKVNTDALEAKSVAFNFGRFAIALLAHRTTPNMDNIDPDLARVVDWRIICEPGKLRAVIEELRASKSQTR